MNVQSRKFLQNLRLNAEEYADNLLNRHWQHAYIELAMAADHCDAILARCSDTETVTPQIGGRVKTWAND